MATRSGVLVIEPAPDSSKEVREIQILCNKSANNEESRETLNVRKKSTCDSGESGDLGVDINGRQLHVEPERNGDASKSSDQREVAPNTTQESFWWTF